VALKGGTANVANLATLILNWENEKTRMKFAFDYWQVGSARPHEGTPRDEDACEA
jgi:hypothetical protein